MAPNQPQVKTGTGGSEKSLNRVWLLEAVERYANQLAPGAYQYVTVTIVGLPQANLNNLYQVALSIASGVYVFKGSDGKLKAGYPFNSTKMVKSDFDYINKTVKVEVGYEQGGYKQAIPSDTDLSGLAMIVRPVPDVIPFMDYPSFLHDPSLVMEGDQGGFRDPGPTIPGATGTALSSAPDSNPGLPDDNNGTYGANAITMSPAPLGPKCVVPPAAPKYEKLNFVYPKDLPPTGTPVVTPANLGQTLRRLFG